MNRRSIRTPIKDTQSTTRHNSAVLSLEFPTTGTALNPLLALRPQGEAWELRLMAPSTATTPAKRKALVATHCNYDDQFSSRQLAAMQMMPPDVDSSYFGSEAGASAGPSLQQPAQGSSGSANVYQQSNAMNYASNSMSSVSAMPQAKNTADLSMKDDHEYAEGALEEKWASYQRQLGSIFQEIVNGSLESASETLLSVTSWLLSQVADLGLNLDDTNLHADRIQLWNDFNHAWLGLGQRQIDLMTSSQQLSRTQSLVSKAMIKKMGNELIRLCDGIERHGLVDYQYGVWEDQITA
ncbi:hypothetical protein FANTH_14643, partial [Fusarium anthophilum]